jgi:hypothetical protein
MLMPLTITLVRKPSKEQAIELAERLLALSEDSPFQARRPYFCAELDNGQAIGFEGNGASFTDALRSGVIPLESDVFKIAL